jgi:hypothetical protein
MPITGNSTTDLSKVRYKVPKSIKGFYNGNWGPKDWFKCKVRYGDNWWKLASLDGWADPWDLIEYNFGTRDPKEVNFYLRHFVGCTHATADGKNHVFTDNLRPGYIYTVHNIRPYDEPNIDVTPMPLPPVEEDPIKLARPGTWRGIGVKGTLFAGAGVDRVEAVVFSPDYSDAYWLSITSFKLGGGATLAGGFVFVMVNGVPTMNDLKYCRLSGFDWGLQLGENIKSVAKTASGFTGLRRLGEAIELRNVQNAVLKEGATSLKALVAANTPPETTKPSVTVVEIPFAGKGLDLSLTCTSSVFSVETLRESDTSLLDGILI